MSARHVTLVIAGLAGAAGVAMAAASAHVPNAQGAQSAAFLLVLHAAAAVAVLAVSLHFDDRRMFRVATALMLLGAILFSADIGLRTFSGARLFANAAPIGGIAMISGWIALAVGSLLNPRRR